MKNELVEKTKNLSREIYNALKTKHEVLKREGEKTEVLNEVVAEAKKAVAIYKGVNEENVETLYSKAINLQNTVEFKYGLTFSDSEFPVIDSVEESRADEEEVEEETQVEESKKGHGGAIALGLASVAALTGLAIHTGMNANRAKNSNVEKTETVEETENNVIVIGPTQETEENKIVPTEEPKVELTQVQETKVEEPQLVLGEYGTFFDVTNDEQVNARAQYIIDNYYSQFMNQLSESERSIITRENIANVIRVMAGELPLDENGNKVMDANIVDNYGAMYTELVGELGSSPQLEGRYFNIPAHLFTTDGTELSEFIKGYDEAYQTITNGFNKAADERLQGVEVTGGTMVREGISTLGTKYWNEWVMQGIYGDTNPYNFSAKDRLFAYLSSFAKYGQTALEYNLDSMQAVCIPVCVNYETKEINEISVNEIFFGYASGEWDTVIAKLAGVEAHAEPDSVAFTQDLFDELNWKYNNLKQLKLN